MTAGKLTPAEAKSLFHQRGRRMNVNGNQGYPVGYNQDGALVVHGADQQLEGKITGAKDSNGVLIADARPAARPRRAASPPISIRIRVPAGPSRSARPCSRASSRPGT